jgi:simple sugar transport system permease protein
MREEAAMTSKAVPADSQSIRETARSREVSAWRRLLLRPEVGALLGAIIVWVVFAFLAWNRGFVSARGVATYLEVAAQLGILAVAVALLMIAGEFDLSVGSIIGAGSVIAALIPTQLGINFWWGIVTALAFSLLIGFLNGLVVVRTALPSFIVTLASLFIIRGITIGTTRLITGRTQVGGLQNTPGFDSAAVIFGADILLFGAAFPVSIIWWIVVAAISTWVLLRTQFGNWIFAVGGNVDSARAVGVPVRQTKIALFMGVGLCAWFMGMHRLFAFNTVQSGEGVGNEFTYIIAAVIGGVLLTGGYGSAIGASLGALIVGMAFIGIQFSGWNTDWRFLFLGVILLLAVLVNNLVRHRAEGARR